MPLSREQLASLTKATLARPADLIELHAQLNAHNSSTPAGVASLQRGFRGQSQTFGTLRPSLQRRFEKANANATVLLIEQKLLSSFIDHYQRMPDRMPDMPQPQDILHGRQLRCLSVMQHYGLPTRLLDWTSDMWIAVYFACVTDLDRDGELWFYLREPFQVLSRAQAQKHSFVFANNAADPNEPEPPLFAMQAADLLLEFSPKQTPRMTRQYGFHTVAANAFVDHAELMLSASQATEAGPSPMHLSRVVIAANCKTKLLNYLNDERGISASSLFPDIEGLGRYLRWQLDSLEAQLL